MANSSSSCDELFGRPDGDLLDPAPRWTALGGMSARRSSRHGSRPSTQQPAARGEALFLFLCARCARSARVPSRLVRTKARAQEPRAVAPTGRPKVWSLRTRPQEHFHHIGNVPIAHQVGTPYNGARLWLRRRSMVRRTAHAATRCECEGRRRAVAAASWRPARPDGGVRRDLDRASTFTRWVGCPCVRLVRSLHCSGACACPTSPHAAASDPSHP